MQILQVKVIGTLSRTLSILHRYINYSRETRQEWEYGNLSEGTVSEKNASTEVVRLGAYYSDRHSIFRVNQLGREVVVDITQLAYTCSFWRIVMWTPFLKSPTMKLLKLLNPLSLALLMGIFWC